MSRSQLSTRRAIRRADRRLSVRIALSGLAAAAVAVATVGIPLAVGVTPAAAAPPTSNTTSITVDTPSVTSITDGTSPAPWNTSQGDPASSAYPTSDLLPTYTPGGPTTGAGATAEPNIAVYPGATSGTAGNSPYPSGVVGTPGPLDGYCGTGSTSTESTGSPSRQPTGTTLPFSPAYFPHIVRNSDGSLTGYFDERPKDADESIVAARSTDNGKDWTYEGQALEQNSGYCPSADINDDGQGHPNVITVGGVSRLYTLNRPSGDNDGVGLLVHNLTPTSDNPLAGLPATEQVGLDPDATAAATASVPTTGGTGTTITVNSTGQANTLEQLVAGGFVDVTQSPAPSPSTVITCTGVGTTTLTGCTTAAAGGATVNPGDLIEQVIGTVNTAATIPKGPNNTLGSSGTKKNLSVTFTSNQTATTLNNNAPNRVYVNGVPLYCPQSNASPTTALEYCTTGPQGTAFAMPVGAIVTADPIVPATAQQTSGLVAPDGIVGVLPTYPGVPAGATAVLYTEKLLNYYVAGKTSNAVNGTYSSSTGSSIPFYAAETTSSALTTPTVASPVTVVVADDTKKVDIPATCTGLTVGTGAINSGANPLIDTLTGCTVPAADNGDTYTSNDNIGLPGGTYESPTTLAKTGEGSTNQDKDYKNNEDLTVLRVAYTTDGINFSSAGLDDNGVISGQSAGASAYTDISNPTATTDPPGGLNQYAAAGTTDATEMRFVGSGGSVVTNPDGSIGLYLSGAWAADGDSDAFNQIFYATSTDGEHWTEPESVVSTDYTFSASRAQDVALAGGTDAPLGVSAYYSGRAYGPSVVPNPDGSLTMVFAGYRLPSPVATAGASYGTNASALYTVGATDPALYRTIMVTTLHPSTSPTVTTSTSVTSSTAAPVVGQPVTYSATVSVPAPGTGTPTGTVTFTDPAGTLCASAALSAGTPDTASCATTYSGTAESDTVTATYSGDANYATSSGSTTVSVSTVPDAPTGVGATAGNGSATVSWTAPSDEGSAITGYTVSDGTGDTCATPDGMTTGCTVTGLTNGSSYSFTVAATNANGTGAASASSNSVTPSAVPDAPTGVTAAPGDASATVSWTAPSDEGSPITGYTVSDGAGDTCTTAGTGCIVTGLTDGSSYSFTVTATNADGTGAASAPSNSVTPSSTPDAPTDVTAAPGDGSATISWVPPFAEGSPITGYTVSDGVGDSCTTPDGSTTSCTVTGLANGTVYSFTVTATNGNGTGVASAASNPVTPSTVPDAPTGISATAANGSATVSWTAPFDEGAAITGYTVSDGVGDTCTTPDGSETSCTVTGLTDGTVYAFTVTATNANGAGPASTGSNPVTPSTVPDAPTGVSAVAGEGSATVSWTAPSDEGSTITGYTVTASTGRTCTAAGTTCTITGLAAGTAVTFTVTATNANGTGAASSASAPVVPTAVPGAPTSVTAVAGNGQATVSWTAPAYAGLPITGYSVVSTSGHSCTTATTSCVVTGLANGASVTFTVKATDADGTGPASAPSNSVVPTSNTAVITSGATVTIAAGKKLDFTVTTSGTPTPTVGESGIAPWMTLTPGTRSAAGTAKITGKGPASGGTYTFTVEADNGVGPATMQPFTVHVLAITSPASATFVPGTAHSVTITTAGPTSGVTLSATLSAKQAGITFHDNGDGTATLSGTATSKDKTAVVVVTATAGSVTTQQKLTVTIS